tara:strand:- start:384 stop:560 length:177 start_codon:yes stop_codon:yes gene_type:complete
MEEKTYILWGSSDENGKLFVDITYQVNENTQKEIRFYKAEHQVQFIDLLIEAGYKDVT